jgi:acyl carrier protein
MNEGKQHEELRRFLALVRRNLKIIDGDAELTMDADLGGMGLDSVSALNLMLDLEEAFGVIFQNSMFTEETFSTPSALWGTLLSVRKR